MLKIYLSNMDEEADLQISENPDAQDHDEMTNNEGLNEDCENDDVADVHYGNKDTAITGTDGEQEQNMDDSGNLNACDFDDNNDGQLEQLMDQTDDDHNNDDDGNDNNNFSPFDDIQVQNTDDTNQDNYGEVDDIANADNEGEVDEITNPDNEGEVDDVINPGNDGEVDDIANLDNNGEVEGGSNDDVEPADAEDGDILEDGEIDEDIEIPVEDKDLQKNKDIAEEHSKSGSSASDSESESKSRKRKRRKKRKRKSERRSKDEKKRKRKKYVDHDRADDDELQQSWPSTGSRAKASPSGPYDSPYNSPPGPYDSPYRSPPGPYDSPPGPYDSPSYDGYNDSRGPESMYSMVEGGYTDINVAASEKQGIFERRKEDNKNLKNNANIRKIEKKRKYFELVEKRRKEAEHTAEKPLCKFHLEGKCQKGEECQFSHDFKPPKKPELCKYHITGYCHKGKDCVYYHEDFPCKFFHMGNKCSNGDTCRFSHEPLTEETMILLKGAIKDKEELAEKVGPLMKARPSLLGDPPEHIKQEAAEKLHDQKKIPSLFDIKVEPTMSLFGLDDNNKGRNQKPTSPVKHGNKSGPGFYKEQHNNQQEQYNPSPQRPALLPTPGTVPNAIPPGAIVQLGAVPVTLGGGMLPQPGVLATLSQLPSVGAPMINPGATMLPPAAVMAQNFYTNFYNPDTSQPPPSLGPNEAMTKSDIESETVKQPEFEIPSNLPAKQRELLLRIQKQQREAVTSDQTNQAKAEDDSWYSSDEEDEKPGSKPQNSLMDIVLKNIANQPGPVPQHSVPPLMMPVTMPVPVQPSMHQAPVFNIAQMLSTIKTQTPAAAQAAAAKTANPRLAKKADPRLLKTETKQDSTVPSIMSESPASPDAPKSPEPKPFEYKVIEVTIPPRTFILPPNYNKKDPRIQKYLKQQEQLGIPAQRQDSLTGNSPTQNSDRALNVEMLVVRTPSDPRVKPNDPRNTVTDPRTKQDPLLAGFTVPKPPDLQRQNSQKSSDSQNVASSLSSDKVANGNKSKSSINYRNDPRFKRKTKSLTVTAPVTQTDDDSESMKRKTNMVYTSPLQSPPAESGGYGYNNRPSQNRHTNVNKVRDSRQGAAPNSQNVDPRQQLLNMHINSEDPRQAKLNQNALPILPLLPDSGQYPSGSPGAIMLPPSGQEINPDDPPTPNLKEMFKSFDPTASPFC